MTLIFDGRRRVCILCGVDTYCRVKYALDNFHNPRDNSKIVCGCICYPYDEEKEGEK